MQWIDVRKIVVREEFVAGERVPHPDLADPLHDLGDEEHHAEGDRQKGVLQRCGVVAAARRLDASRDCPRTQQQDDGVEDADPQIKIGLRTQERFAILGAGHQIDREVSGEEQRLEEDEHPHVGLARHELGVLVVKLLGPR